MDIRDTKEGPIAIVELVGSVDTRSSFDFEKKVSELLAEDSRFFVVDFAEVDQLTSSGIRVLLMLGQKLSRLDGAMALCRLNDHVQTVIEISGLGGHLSVFGARTDALAHLSSITGTRSAKVSKMSSLAALLLGGSPDSELPAEGLIEPSGESSRLSQEVALLLAEEPDGESEEHAGESVAESHDTK